MRFGLASSLMFDGYFGFTNRDGAYRTCRWYDEYSVDIGSGAANSETRFKGYLGKPAGAAYNIDRPDESLKDALRNEQQDAEKKAWRRDFENGIVVVNPGNKERLVDLHGIFKKIRGSIDPRFNDGSSISQIQLSKESGVILLRNN